MGKAADNERAKIRATFWNNMAVGLSMTGLVLPYISIYSTGEEGRQFITELIHRNITNVAMLEKFLSGFLVVAFSWTMAVFCRLWARQEANKIQD